MDDPRHPPLLVCASCGMRQKLSFGLKLDLLRRAKGLTIGELALKSGVPEKTMERVILGQNAPSASHFVRIIKALCISMDAIEPGDLE